MTAAFQSVHDTNSGALADRRADGNEAEPGTRGQLPEVRTSYAADAARKDVQSISQGHIGPDTQVNDMLGATDDQDSPSFHTVPSNMPTKVASRASDVERSQA